MQFFHELGQRFESLWKENDHDVQHFSHAAEAALREMPPSEHLDYMEVIDWSQRSDRLPLQADLAGDFGNPPITVYQSNAFRIEVLFWVDGTTAIHQHGFSGAFHVLHGSSIHSRFAFKEHHRFSEQLLNGKLTLDHLELLSKGAIRPILSSAEMIHSLYHLDRPSVSVVVRTHYEPRAQPQYAYARTGLAYNPFYKTESLTRKLQTLHLLHSIEYEGFEASAERLAAASDSISTYFIIAKIFELIREEVPFKALLERIRPHHPHLVPLLDQAFAEFRRERNIMARRGQFRNADHRFFMALLLNVTGRRRILELIKKRYPESPPIDKVLTWVEELAQTKLEGEKNAIGIPLDESSLFIFRGLVEGLTFAQLIAKMNDEYSDDEVREQLGMIQETCDAFKESLLFSSLLTDD